MNDIQLIEKVLEPHEISVFITGPLGDEIEVTVSVPDLRSAPRNVWGDWGPMYTVAMPPDRRIEFSVRGRARPAASRRVLDLSHLELESPALAVTREVTPLLTRLPLPDANAILLVFYDTRGRVARVDLAPATGAGGIPGLYRVSLADGSRLEPAAVGSHD